MPTEEEIDNARHENLAQIKLQAGENARQENHKTCRAGK